MLLHFAERQPFLVDLTGQFSCLNFSIIVQLWFIYLRASASLWTKTQLRYGPCHLVILVVYNEDDWSHTLYFIRQDPDCLILALGRSRSWIKKAGLLISRRKQVRFKDWRIPPQILQGQISTEQKFEFLGRILEILELRNHQLGSRR